MTAEELKRRTKQYALHVMSLGESLPRTRSGRILADQLIRSATSVGANYRAACRARSDADFASKVGVTLEEADESVFWMELIVESGMKSESELMPLMKKGRELVAIFVASSNTIRSRMNKPKTNSKSKI